MRKDEIKSERKSYLLYSRKSLFVNKRSYIILFISVICMVVMSMNIIIYNSSVSNGENETVLHQYGNYHAYFKGIEKEDSLFIDMYEHLGSSLLQTRTPHLKYHMRRLRGTVMTLTVFT